uniref:Protein Smaug (inferred by orthology to a D. melanogaster protein) n=1 Tax=Strongyloides venezuelensis TaxID=75913 RepID=A0A0K0FMD7_STRVS
MESCFLPHDNVSSFISNPFDDIINKLPFSDNEFVLTYDYETSTSGNSSDNDYGSFSLFRSSSQNSNKISLEFKHKWGELLSADFNNINDSYFEGNKNLVNTSRIKSYGDMINLVQELVKTFKLNENTQESEYIMNLLDKIADPPMREMAGWLKDLRLHKYTPFFLSIKYETFLALSDDMLVEVGVTIGARRKILQSVNTLKERISNCYQYDKIITEKDDLKSVIVFLKDLSLTPMQKYIGKESESESQVDGFNKSIEFINSENLPGHFCRLLHKLYLLIKKINDKEVEATYDTLDGKCYQMLDTICKRIQLVNAFTKNQKILSKEWQEYYKNYLPNKSENTPPQKKIKNFPKFDSNQNNNCINISVINFNTSNRQRFCDYKEHGNSFSKDGSRYYRKNFSKKNHDISNKTYKPTFIKKPPHILYINSEVSNLEESTFIKKFNYKNVEQAYKYNANKQKYQNSSSFKSRCTTRTNVNNAVQSYQRDESYISC